METHLDIYQTARELIEQHGDEALLIAQMRADVLSHHHDAKSAAMWLGVVRAIKVLTSKPHAEND
jgi:hypothetical protein